MVEICIDVAKHIIADEGYRLPEDAKDSLTVLKGEGVISSETEEVRLRLPTF